MAPQWYLRYRRAQYTVYMVITTMLFGVFYLKKDMLTRVNDPNRIEGLKSVRDLEQED